jgi:hypothetical protein
MAIQTVIHDSIEKFNCEQWNTLNETANPFVSYEFFKALEAGKCVKGHSGWHPLYFGILEDEKLSCALVAYIKTDSYGEFIFDWDWARAYQQYGLPYYPKLTVAVPYSPISAPKVLGNLEVAKDYLLPSLWNFYQKESLTGLHFLFTRDKEADLLKGLGLVERDSFQYHWHRKTAQSFDDYLSTLRKNRRKSIKRERREVSQYPNLTIETINGSNLSETEVSFFYQCYLTTIDKKWSQAYLSEEFFREFFNTKSDQVYLVVAKEDGELVACALYLKSSDTLFGRYWGAVKEIPFLHFELCIYRGIELAIELNLERFEAGAQGEHKRMRGFSPVLTKSYHHLKEPQFFKAVCDFLDREKKGIEHWFKEFAKESPLKELRKKN